MKNQLEIPCEMVNKSGFDIAKKEFDITIKNKDLHPVFLIFNATKHEYFVSRFFSREFIENYHTFKILE